MRPSSEGAQIDIKIQGNLIKPRKTEGCWSTTGSQWNQQNQEDNMKPCKNEGSWSTKGSEYTPKTQGNLINLVKTKDRGPQRCLTGHQKPRNPL